MEGLYALIFFAFRLISEALRTPMAIAISLAPLCIAMLIYFASRRRLHGILFWAACLALLLLAGYIPYQPWQEVLAVTRHTDQTKWLLVASWISGVQVLLAGAVWIAYSALSKGRAVWIPALAAIALSTAVLLYAMPIYARDTAMQLASQQRRELQQAEVWECLSQVGIQQADLTKNRVRVDYWSDGNSHSPDCLKWISFASGGKSYTVIAYFQDIASKQNMSVELGQRQPFAESWPAVPSMLAIGEGRGFYLTRDTYDESKWWVGAWTSSPNEAVAEIRSRFTAQSF